MARCGARAFADPGLQSRKPPTAIDPFQKFLVLFGNGVPYGIRTRVTNVKGWCPRPLDERDMA